MYQMLCILMATIYGTEIGHCQTPGTVAVTFESSTYSDFRQLLTGEAATGKVTIRADLGSFPKRKRIGIRPSSSFTRSAATGMPTRAMPSPGCARPASLPWPMTALPRAERPGWPCRHRPAICLPG
jgi:hypothetical protein